MKYFHLYTSHPDANVHMTLLGGKTMAQKTLAALFSGLVLITLPTSGSSQPPQISESFIEPLDKKTRKTAKNIARTQQLLADAGYYKDEINGQLDHSTTQAIKAFQSDNKFPPSGILTKFQTGLLSSIAARHRDTATNANSTASSPASDLPTKEVQRLLASGGFYKEALHGLFNHATKEAIAQFQLANGFPATEMLTVAQVELLKRQAISAGTIGNSENDNRSKERKSHFGHESSNVDAANPRSEAEHEQSVGRRLTECAQNDPSRLTYPGHSFEEHFMWRYRNIREKFSFTWAEFDRILKPDCTFDEIATNEIERLRSERAQGDLDKKLQVESDAKKQRDSSDVVAQVLNYTSTGFDEGLDNEFWVRESECVYRQFSHGSMSGKLNLNELNPEVIKIEQRFLGNGTTYHIVTHEGNPIINLNLMEAFVSDLAGKRSIRDPQRLSRGWALIYSKHCKGKKTAF